MYISNTSQTKVCINCRKKGHFYKECKYPLNSYGIILFRVSDTGRVEYLFVCRKHTFGYVELLRGGYKQSDYDTIRQLLTEVTLEERDNILTRNFRWLWENLWMIKLEDENEKSLKDYNVAKVKFEQLIVDNQFKLLLEQVPCLWTSPEWGFPKGRKNWGEDEQTCAMRECFEETSVDMDKYRVVNEFSSQIENFKGTDNRMYRNTYYICFCYDNQLAVGVDTMNLSQQREISKISWFDLSSAIDNIRPYNIEKINLLSKIDSQIKSNISMYMVKKNDTVAFENDEDEMSDTDAIVPEFNLNEL